MTKDISNPVEIDETELDQAKGGAILAGLLLPAVQKIRATDEPEAGKRGGAHVKVFDGLTGA